MTKCKFSLFESAYICMILGGCLFANLNYYLSAGCKILSLILFLLAFFESIQTFNVSRIIKTLAVSAVLLFAFVFFDFSQTIALSCMLLIARKKINFDRIATIDLTVRSFSIVGTIILFAIGLISEYSFIAKFFGVEVVRHSLGFAHPNNLFLNFVVLLVDYFILYRNKKENIKLLSAIIIFSTIAFFVTFCRTGFLIECLFVVLYLIQKKKNYFKWDIVKFVSKYYIIIIFAVSIIILVGYNADIPIFVTLNKLMTGRLKSAARYFDTYSISLLPQSLNKVSTLSATLENHARILDSSYYNLILEFGLIITGIYIYLCVTASKKYYKNKDYILVLVIMLFLTYGITEGIVLNPYYNISLVLMSVALNTQKT